MSRNKKQKIVCICLLLAIAAAAGIAYYHFYWAKEPEDMRGGVLVHERYTVYSNRQKC